MTTAIVGLGNIGSRLAENLVDGGREILLAGRDLDSARRLAGRLGDRATAVTVDRAVDRADILVLAVWYDTLRNLITEYGDRLNGTIVVDPSNPYAPGGRGGFTRRLPDDESAAVTLAALLPDGARLVKAFGTLTAGSLRTAARRTPQRAVGFYAADDQEAGDAVAELIRAAGFEPLPVGGLDQALRIELPRDLHEMTLGRLPDIDEARRLLRSRQ
ncbi:NADPH-dependent F420 reductase [Streptomyces jumonjinensis]|uniref:NADPH-dependent F420 reductase n=1 Tax=Streptomyces jumonjinensis TaxID=1945 RepID=UPI0037A2C11A